MKLIERRRMGALRRERQEFCASFRSITPALCAAGVQFSRTTVSENLRVLGTLASGPGEDEELDFEWMPDSSTEPWTSSSIRDQICRTALSELASEKTPVAVIWHPYRAGLKIRAGDLGSQIGTVLNEGSGEATWIVSGLGARWIIQIAFWSRTISWARHVP